MKNSNGMKKVNILSLITVFCLVFAVIALFFAQEKISKLQKNQTALEQQDVLRLAEINDLENTLAQELVYHCDTMTISEKIKEAKLRDYDLKVWTINEEKKTESFNSRQKADMDAFQKKESESLKAFIVYMKEKSFRLMSWSKEDPKSFNIYVFMTFWESNTHSGPETDYLFQKNEEIKKLPAVKAFINFDADAYAKYQLADKVLQQKYEVALKENEKRYQAEQADLDVEYKKLVEHKKFELGL